MTTEAELLDDINGSDEPEPEEKHEKVEAQPEESSESSTEEKTNTEEAATDVSDGALGVSGQEGGHTDSGFRGEAGDQDKEEVEPTGELMSPADLARKQKFENWQLGFNQRLGTNISVNVDGVVDISGASDEEVEQALYTASESELTSNSISSNLKIMVAEFIIELAARKSKDYAEIISDYNICETIGRKLESLYRWIRVVQEIPKEKLRYGLSMTQYEAVALVRHPSNKKDEKKFISARNQILDNAAGSPKGFGSRQMSNELKSFVDKIDPKEKGERNITPAQSLPLIVEYGNRYRLRDHGAVNPEIYDELGITKAQNNDGIASIEAILIERGIFNPDITAITLIAADEDEEENEDEEGDVIDVEAEEVSSGEEE